MPKMKSHKASRRRIRLSATGKLMRTQIAIRHLLADRSPKRMRNKHHLTETTAAGYKRRARFALLTKQGRGSK
jgi:large subunit ribosomal protein L35